jgi:rare lipoprotein A
VIFAIAGCAPPPPAGSPHWTLGEPYQMGGMWSYPAERFAGSDTGLAAVLPATRKRTTNGEYYDPQRLVAAHRILQLPAIVTVENLETGKALRVRVNDRGPENPARLLGLSPRAAALLGVTSTAQIRVTVDEAASRALARSLPGGDASLPKVAAAPTARVERETLAPPPGARAADPPPYAVAHGSAPPPAEARDPGLPPDPLPETVTQGTPAPGRLWLEASTFERRDLAAAQARRLGGEVERVGEGRQVQWRVRRGPFADVASADAAFAAARRAGLNELKLLVD